MDANPNLRPKREDAMTPERMEAEIESLRQQQIRQKKLWLRWGLASNAIGLLLCAAVLLKVALTGDDPPPPMIFIVLTYLFVGLVFITAGRAPAERVVARRMRQRDS
jgi:hypothetical protein